MVMLNDMLYLPIIKTKKNQIRIRLAFLMDQHLAFIYYISLLTFFVNQFIINNFIKHLQDFMDCSWKIPHTLI